MNKTESAVVLRWNPGMSTSFSENDQRKIIQHLSRSLNKDGELLIRSSESRSQRQNKDHCVEKWMILIEKALKPRIKRIATKPTRSSKVRRVDEKKRHSEIKKLRGKIPNQD